jgi:DHA2 family multidrug resistance protein
MGVGILAFYLVNRLVQDPPWIKADRANLMKLDYIGLGFLTVAMGGMQIMLDKREANDWFASTFIRVFGFLFVSGMAGLTWWQWRAKNPIMNLRLFKYKNFAICCFLMILVGGVLNAATVLEPQFLQQLMGYTATHARQTLAGEGLALLIVMPLGGIATGRFPARNMAAFGFSCFAGAFYYTSTHFTLTMTFGFASGLRILQMFAIPFAFIAITSAAYVGLPKEASNQVSGIINFVRNVGRQHLYCRHGSDCHQPVSLPSGAPAGVHAAQQSRLRQPSQRAYLILRWWRKRPGPRPHGTSRHLPGA